MIISLPAVWVLTLAGYLLVFYFSKLLIIIFSHNETSYRTYGSLFHYGGMLFFIGYKKGAPNTRFDAPKLCLSEKLLECNLHTNLSVPTAGNVGNLRRITNEAICWSIVVIGIFRHLGYAKNLLVVSTTV